MAHSRLLKLEDMRRRANIRAAQLERQDIGPLLAAMWHASAILSVEIRQARAELHIEPWR